MNTIHQPYINYESGNYTKRLLNYMNSVFINGLTENSPQITQPVSIKLGLREHQRTAVAAMKTHEENMLRGFIQTNDKGHEYITRGNVGILGDPVGSGKSLTVLSYIAHLKETAHEKEITIPFVRSYNSDGYTLHNRTYEYDDLKNGKNLIVVPFSLIPQWTQYIKTQTTLNANIIKKKTDISNNSIFFSSLHDTDLTIVSSSMFSEFMDIIEPTDMWFERFIVDEVDSIKISRNCRFPTSIFKWYISASWPNIIMDGAGIHRDYLETILNSTTYNAFHPETINWLAEYMHTHTNYYVRHDSFRSSAYFNNGININTANTYIDIIRTSTTYYKKSFDMPAVHVQVHICKRSAVNNALNGLVDRDIQQLIDADDIHGALGALHLNTHTSMNLISAVETRYLKDIEHIQNTITYRENMEYVSASQKEDALAQLRRTKQRTEDQLNTFRTRLTGLSGELCPICYDIPTDVIYTPCCNHLYCAGCILKCLRLQGKCPMCRGHVGADQLVHIQDSSSSTPLENGPPRKRDILLQLLKESPKGRFLVFSHHDNPFENLGTDCEDAKIKYKILKGNMHGINKAVEDFEKGKIQVLFLNSRELGVGLNLVSATHVILYHSLKSEEEKQVIGRALRMGRVAPLTVHKLHHAGEGNTE